jgi:diacylglycerol kinase (ATP)
LKKKIAFIINPFSGSVKKYNIPEAIEQHLDHTKYDYEVIFTTHSGHAIEISQNLSNTDIDIICGVGGDGSLHEIVNGLTNPNITLAIIPIGSGNGLASHIGYKPRNIKDAFDIINVGYDIHIDMGMVDGKKFISVFGVGLDAEVAYQYKHRTKRSLFAYASLALKEVFSDLRYYEIDFEIDDVKRHEKVLMICGFNSDQFGYNMGIVPWASATDGIMDVAIIKKMHWIKLPWVGFCLLIKKPNWSSDIEIIPVKKMCIKHREEIKFQIDGDPYLFSQDLHVAMLKGILKIIVRKP